MDRLTPEQRKKNMQAVKSKGSRIEISLAKALWNYGYRYRKNDKSIFGKPDFVFKKEKLAVFCDGEFWHGKDWEVRKNDHKSNREFWHAKIERNMERDKEVNAELERQGWTVLRLWESEIQKDLPVCLQKIKEIIDEKREGEKNRNEITINETCNGKKFKLQIYGPHSLNDDGTLMTFNEQMAVVTHYLHNRHTAASKPLEEKAKGLIEDIYKIKFADDERENFAADDPVYYNVFKDVFSVPFPAPEHPKFTFIDLFAGIGGFRMAMQNLGGKCVFSSEWDEQAQKTYQVNYGEVPFGDITKESAKQYIPDNFDILCAGFPCQAFSLAGKRMGFAETRGTLFFEVAEIIRRKRPKAIFLENVKGLRNHDKGKTLQTILNVLRKDLDYFVPEPEIVNAMNFGVPQHRERIYIVGFRKDSGVSEFTYPLPTDKTKTFADNRDGLRKMTPREWARLQGFPDRFEIVVADASAYKQFGNSVAVPAIQATGIEIIKRMDFSKEKRYGKI